MADIALNSNPTNRDDQASRPNWPLLALLRFFLALIVCLFHTAQSLRDPAAPVYDLFSARAAVIVFFLISGYSMADSFGRSPNGFFRRRFCRIAPIYWTGCLLSLLPFLFFGGHIVDSFGNRVHAPGFWGFLPVLLAVDQLDRMHGLLFDPAMWSINVEFAYYLAVPLIAKVNPRQLAMLAVVSSCLYGVHLNQYGIALYGQCLGFFCLGYLHYQKPRSWKIRGLILVLPSLAVLPAILPVVGWGYHDYFAPCTAVVGGLVFLCSPGWTIPAKFRPLALYLGDLSFPLYAIFWPVAWMARFGLPSPEFHRAAYLLPVQLILAAIILVTIDKPLRRLGRKSSKPPESALDNPAIQVTSAI